MSWAAFETRVPGKWVLAGEHAVLRGQMAVALPHPEFALSLRFAPGGKGFRVRPVRSEGLLREVVELAQRQAGAPAGLPDGELSLESTIPFGAGLGSSAALCVAITQWLSSSLAIAPAAQFEFARGLENRFHGKSSGMDIAAALTAAPIAFFMQGPDAGPRPLGVARTPRFTFHDTGLRAKTVDCVRKVQELIARDPGKGARIDAQMGEAAKLAAEGLRAYETDSDAGLDLLARSMGLAQECFEAWGLVPDQARRKLDEVLASGARAAKITGAGAGGMIVAIHG